MKAFAHVVAASLRRRQVEKVLWESEERYRTLVENVPIGIYRNTPGPTGRFLMANPAFLRMFGFETEEELKQITVADLYANPGERKTFSDNLLAQGSVAGVEIQLRRKDGTLMWGSVTARVVRDEQTGGTAYFDCTIEDITERKGVEEQIRQNAARAEALAAISQVLAESGLDYQAALDTVARRTAELIGDGCVVTLVSDDGQWLRPVALYHPNQEALAFMRHLLIPTPQRVGEGISGRVAQTGEPALVPVVPQDQIRAIFKPEYLPYLGGDAWYERDVHGGVADQSTPRSENPVYVGLHQWGDCVSRQAQAGCCLLAKALQQYGSGPQSAPGIGCSPAETAGDSWRPGSVIIQGNRALPRSQEPRVALVRVAHFLPVKLTVQIALTP
jgi:PAS domain S-box-containing protein